MQSAVDLSRPGLPAGFKTGHGRAVAPSPGSCSRPPLSRCLRCCRLASSSGWRCRPAGRRHRRWSFGHASASFWSTPSLLVACAGADLDRAVGGAGLADRTQRPARRSPVGLAVGCPARHPCLRPQLCLDQRWCRPARPVGRRAGFGRSPISRSSICRSRRRCAVSTRRLRMPPRLARALGPWRVFARVVLPQLRLAICGGSLLVGLHLLAEYGLYVFIRFDTFTTAIVDQFQSSFQRTGRQHAGRRAGRLLPRAAGAGSRCCAVTSAMRASALVRRASSQRTRLGQRHACLPGAARIAALLCARRAVRDHRPLAGRRRHRCLAASTTIGLALGQTLFAGRCRRRADSLDRGHPHGLAFDPRAGPAVSASSKAATTSSARCPASSSRWRWSPSPYASRCRSTRPCSRMLFAYALMFLPRALISLRASIAQAPVELEQAAASLGRPPLKALWSIDHPPVGAGGCGRRGAGRARHHQRADRHPDAGAQRHPHAGHGVLGL